LYVQFYAFLQPQDADIKIGLIMSRVLKHVKTFLVEEDGPTAVEYAVMLAAILMGVIATIGSVGAASGGLWGRSNTELQAHGF
jgi:pilus assembly protein Flp/PilA